MTMGTKLIKGLSQIQGKYDAFLIDLWGVVHNGVELYPNAVEVLKNLSKFNYLIILSGINMMLKIVKIMFII